MFPRFPSAAAAGLWLLISAVAPHYGAQAATSPFECPKTRRSFDVDRRS
jgi:hypothetical protein